MSKIRYSEIFFSFQGEAGFAGMPSVWLRMFGCNLRCPGFGQDNPTDPSTYEDPLDQIPLADITEMEELPVITKGCDSAYSWHPAFKRLAKTEEIRDVAKKLIDLAREKGYNRRWAHPATGQKVQLCITGGEPLLQQSKILELFHEIEELCGTLPQITIETNGTVPLDPRFIFFLTNRPSVKIYFSVSPKLFHVSGERDGVDPSTIAGIFEHADGWLKFVVNGSEEAWKEIEQCLQKVRRLIHLEADIWAMPEGATKESQERVAELCDEIMRRGYLVATRNHAYVYGNQIGK